jgi:hypothetical protein
MGERSVDEPVAPGGRDDREVSDGRGSVSADVAAAEEVPLGATLAVTSETLAVTSETPLPAPSESELGSVAGSVAVDTKPTDSQPTKVKDETPAAAPDEAIDGHQVKPEIQLQLDHSRPR